MRCKHCGALLKNGTRTCHFCSSVLKSTKAKHIHQDISDAEPIPNPVAANDTQSFEKTSKTGDLIPKFSLWIPTVKEKIIVAGILLAVILVGFCIYKHFFTAEWAVSKYESVVNGEIDQLHSLAPDDYWQTMASNSIYTTEEYIAMKADELRIDHERGSTKSARFTVLESDQLNYTERQRIARDLYDKYGIEQYRVTAATELDIRIQVTGKSRDSKHLYSVTAVKIDSQWYLVRYNSLSRKYDFVAAGSISGLWNTFE